MLGMQKLSCIKGNLKRKKQPRNDSTIRIFAYKETKNNPPKKSYHPKKSQANGSLFHKQRYDHQEITPSSFKYTYTHATATICQNDLAVTVNSKNQTHSLLSTTPGSMQMGCEL